MVKLARTGCHDSVHRFCLRLVILFKLLIVAEMILAAASLSTDFAYAPTNDQLVAVFIGIILFHGLLNTLNTAWLARITSVLCQRLSADNSITPSLISDRHWQLLSRSPSCRNRRTMLILLLLRSLTVPDGPVTAFRFSLGSSVSRGS